MPSISALSSMKKKKIQTWTQTWIWMEWHTYILIKEEEERKLDTLPPRRKQTNFNVDFVILES